MSTPMAEQNCPKRFRVFADLEVELPLAIRYGIFGLACFTYFSFMLVCNQWIQMPEGAVDDFVLRALEDATYWLPGFFLLAPFAFLDFMKSCNRFTRPVTRLRREIKLLIENKSERPLEIEAGDHWAEMLSHYNHIRGELLTLRREVSEYEAMLGQVAIGSLQQSPADQVAIDTESADQPAPGDRPAKDPTESASNARPTEVTATSSAADS
jgi:hypothetical protein